MKVILSLFIFFIFGTTYAQIVQIREIDSLDVVKELESLKECYSNVVGVPSDYECAFYKALSYYPDLEKTHIKFTRKRIGTTLNCRPTVTSLLFRVKEKRRYVIRLNNDPTSEAVKINEVSFNAKIGVFGHEIAHVQDYNKRTIVGIVRRAGDYLDTRRKAKFEKEIDKNTILVGLGWQAYDWAYYMHYLSSIPEEYRKFKEDTYLGPEEIMSIIETNSRK